jgi:hypothetical protein
MAAGAGQDFEIGGKGTDQRLVGQVRGAADGQHGVRAGYRPVGFHIDADVDFRLVVCHVWNINPNTCLTADEHR